MRDIHTITDTVNLCKALASPVRIQILKLIAERKQINMNDIAESLGLTNGAITQHMKSIIEADLVEFMYTPGKRGSQKICVLKEHKFMIDVLSQLDHSSMYQTEIPVGTYTRYSIFPTCGIATKTSLIGEADDPRYFDDPLVNDAGILWFSRGFVEYRVPNYLRPHQSLDEIQISFEISSEAPGVCSNWPSDIHFAVNDIPLGYWTSPGDFGGAVKGLFTPDWWDPNWNAWGVLKLLSVTKEGTYIDGGKISDVNIDALNITPQSSIDFRISVPEDAVNIGGATLFGKGFGNYNQDIKVRMIFTADAP
ncbi:MAG: ArsR family transcriptional regulator [Spirochaetales bacterium]|nr:ArsR family transcriptional regulator [Spirochaetales bacterium]